MDITCPQCNTEYEFDDSKITETGVTVKCTNCNYMFKVRRKAVVEMEPVSAPPMVLHGASSPPTAAEPEGVRPWMIRTVEGNVYNFNELTTLQQWIVQRKVARTDQISRTGEVWKTLGDIAELAPFFQVVEAAMASEQRPSHMGEEPEGAEVGGSSSDYQGEQQAEPSEMGGGRLSEEPAFAEEQVQFHEVGRKAAWEQGDAPPADRFRDSSVYDDVPRRRGGKLLLLVGLPVLLLGGGAFAAYKLGLFGGGSDGPPEVYTAGRKLFLMDDAESFKLADAQFAKAPQTQGLVQAARAEVYTTWVQHLNDEADLLEARAVQLEGASATEPTKAPDPAAVDEARQLRLKAGSLRSEASSKLSQAGIYANTALQSAPENPAVKRAMADYLRLQGRGKEEVMPLLEAVRAQKDGDPESYYVEGAFWLGQKDRSKAEDLLRDAISRGRRAELPILRASFLLALLYFKDGQRDQANEQVSGILSQNPGHTWAEELKRLLASPSPATAAAPTAPDAGVSRPDQQIVKTAQPTPPPAKGGDDDAVPVAAGGSYDSQVAQANKLIERGRTMQALKLFESAIAKNPSGVEALTGKGYCYLDQERTGEAISFFKKALNLSPTFGDALLGMGDAYQAQGNLRKALDYYQAYITAHPSGTKTSIAKRQVSDIERKLGTSSTPSPSPQPSPIQPPPSQPPPSQPAPSPPVEPTPAPTPPPTLPSDIPEKPPVETP